MGLQGAFAHSQWDGGRALLRGLCALIKQMMLFNYTSICEGPKLQSDDSFLSTFSYQVIGYGGKSSRTLDRA